ncbi:MAG: hypothetical protein QFE16_13065 [Pseudomonadota bacterium]|nr:hypothetical protein [Pseudomonadota bacterium]
MSARTGVVVAILKEPCVNTAPARVFAARPLVFAAVDRPVTALAGIACTAWACRVGAVTEAGFWAVFMEQSVQVTREIDEMRETEIRGVLDDSRWNGTRI